jgi:RHS repeat-associated protein
LNGVVVEQYRYGANRTRTSEFNSLRGIANVSLSYSQKDNLVTAAGASYTYDADGFLSSKTVGSLVTRYTYSTLGELLGVTFPNGTVIHYTYDPLGRRIAREVNGAVVQKYLWQGRTNRLLAVYDANDNPITVFLYADGRLPLAMTAGGVNYYLCYDQVGTLRVVTDTSGAIVKQINYDSFGNVISDSNPSFAVPFGFAGGLYDPDTGLVHFGARDYDPGTGMWTAKDQLLFNGGDTNLYGYCLADPINPIDSLGLLGWSDFTFTSNYVYLDNQLWAFRDPGGNYSGLVIDVI